MTHKNYIKFNAPTKQDYTNTSGFLLKAATKILKAIIPMANPDYDHLIHQVYVWKLEYDTELDTTWREIGFDVNGKAILAMATGGNVGYWTDNSLNLNDYQRFFQPVVITKEEFENDWDSFIDNN